MSGLYRALRYSTPRPLSSNTTLVSASSGAPTWMPSAAAASGPASEAVMVCSARSAVTPDRSNSSSNAVREKVPTRVAAPDVFRHIGRQIGERSIAREPDTHRVLNTGIARQAHASATTGGAST